MEFAELILRVESTSSSWTDQSDSSDDSSVFSGISERSKAERRRRALARRRSEEQNEAEDDIEIVFDEQMDPPVQPANYFDRFKISTRNKAHEESSSIDHDDEDDEDDEDCESDISEGDCPSICKSPIRSVQKQSTFGAVSHGPGAADNSTYTDCDSGLDYWLAPRSQATLQLLTEVTIPDGDDASNSERISAMLVEHEKKMDEDLETILEAEEGSDQLASRGNSADDRGGSKVHSDSSPSTDSASCDDASGMFTSIDTTSDDTSPQQTSEEHSENGSEMTASTSNGLSEESSFEGCMQDDDISTNDRHDHPKKAKQPASETVTLDRRNGHKFVIRVQQPEGNFPSEPTQIIPVSAQSAASVDQRDDDEIQVRGRDPTARREYTAQDEQRSPRHGRNDGTSSMEWRQNSLDDGALAERHAHSTVLWDHPELKQVQNSKDYEVVRQGSRSMDPEKEIASLKRHLHEMKSQQESYLAAAVEKAVKSSTEQLKREKDAEIASKLAAMRQSCEQKIAQVKTESAGHLKMAVDKAVETVTQRFTVNRDNHVAFIRRKEEQMAAEFNAMRKRYEERIEDLQAEKSTQVQAAVDETVASVTQRLIKHRDTDIAMAVTSFRKQLEQEQKGERIAAVQQSIALRKCVEVVKLEKGDCLRQIQAMYRMIEEAKQKLKENHGQDIESLLLSPNAMKESKYFSSMYDPSASEIENALKEILSIYATLLGLAESQVQERDQVEAQQRARIEEIRKERNDVYVQLRLQLETQYRADIESIQRQYQSEKDQIRKLESALQAMGREKKNIEEKYLKAVESHRAEIKKVRKEKHLAVKVETKQSTSSDSKKTSSGIAEVDSKEATSPHQQSGSSTKQESSYPIRAQSPIDRRRRLQGLRVTPISTKHNAVDEESSQTTQSQLTPRSPKVGETKTFFGSSSPRAFYGRKLRKVPSYHEEVVNQSSKPTNMKDQSPVPSKADPPCGSASDGSKSRGQSMDPPASLKNKDRLDASKQLEERRTCGESLPSKPEDVRRDQPLDEVADKPNVVNATVESGKYDSTFLHCKLDGADENVEATYSNSEKNEELQVKEAQPATQKSNVPFHRKPPLPNVPHGKSELMQKFQSLRAAKDSASKNAPLDASPPKTIDLRPRMKKDTNSCEPNSEAYALLQLPSMPSRDELSNDGDNASLSGQSISAEKREFVSLAPTIDTTETAEMTDDDFLARDKTRFVVIPPDTANEEFEDDEESRESTSAARSETFQPLQFSSSFTATSSEIMDIDGTKCAAIVASRSYDEPHSSSSSSSCPPMAARKSLISRLPGISAFSPTTIETASTDEEHAASSSCATTEVSVSTTTTTTTSSTAVTSNTLRNFSWKGKRNHGKKSYDCASKKQQQQTPELADQQPNKQNNGGPSAISSRRANNFVFLRSARRLASKRLQGES